MGLNYQGTPDRITNAAIWNSYELHDRVSPHSARRRYRDGHIYLTSLICWMTWE